MTTFDPTDFCETFLRSEIASNTEKNILPSESAVAERLLARRLEMAPVYAELHRELSPDERAIRVFLGIILSATFWDPEAIAEARANRARLGVVNAEIAGTADALAQLLREREELHNHSGFYSHTEYHPLNLIDRAGEDIYLYKSYVRDSLKATRTYDLKYWPKIADCIEVLAHDAEEAEIEAGDDITEDATSASRKGLADYLKAILAGIESRREGLPILLPLDFTLSDASFAAVINCSLDLDADDGIGADFVKGFRQRQRLRKGDGA
ncbi:MAG: hypothetical protein ABI395_07465 [Sphingobium sp.]